MGLPTTNDHADLCMGMHRRNARYSARSPATRCVGGKVGCVRLGVMRRSGDESAPTPRSYERPVGHHIVRCYPVEGETFAEVWFSDSAWAQVTISDIHHDLVGEARVADARFLLSLYPPPSNAAHEWWEFDLDDVRTQLDEARAWLLGNEQAIQPIDQDALTAAGKAFSKIGTPDREQ